MRLLETYGITEEDYRKMYDAQGGRCAICEGKRPGNLDVDHDHKVEKDLLARGYPKQVAARLSVRGLCCRRCNRRLLPSSLDDPQVLLRAIEYLHCPPAVYNLHASADYRTDSSLDPLAQWRKLCEEYVPPPAAWDGTAEHNPWIAYYQHVYGMTIPVLPTASSPPPTANVESGMRASTHTTPAQEGG